MPNHDEYIHQILTAIESGRPITQRSLSREMGVALGLMNLLIRRLAGKGYVKIAGLQRNRVRYLITPAGIAEKTRVSRAYFENTVRLYTETRERIRVRFEELSSTWAEPEGGDIAASRPKRLVFYGAGEVAEIAYVSLQSTDLTLVGVIDDHPGNRFFGLPVVPVDLLGKQVLDGQPFGRLVITSLRHADRMQSTLQSRGFPSANIVLL